MKIIETNDFSIFKLHPDNRQLSPALVERFKIALQKNNLTKFRPIIIDNENRILDGQHRLEAAKSLGIKIWYTVKEDAIETDLIDINNTGEVWKFKDYLNYYCKKGNANYLTLRELIKKYGLRDRVVVTFIKNYTYDSFKKGTIEVCFQEKVTEVMDTYLEILNWINISIPYDQKAYIRLIGFTVGLINFLNYENVNHQFFIKKLKQRSEILTTQSSSSKYVQLFTKIYNYRNHNPLEIPIEN